MNFCTYEGCFLPNEQNSEPLKWPKTAVLELVDSPKLISRKISGRKILKFPHYVYLIYNFRQWFLVTSWNPLIVWMYRDSYLRFCSRPFTLSCGHESIHLCNNAVQARYTNAERSTKLPPDNMWDNKTFIQFLKEQGHGDKWHNLIYPTMKKCLISK